MTTYVFIPENLDTELLITLNPPKSITKFSIDRLHYLLSLFNSIPANNKDLEIVDDWIPFYTPLLRRVVPNYKAYLEYLQVVEVIKCNNHYRDGKSKCYKLLPKYQTFLKAVVITNRTVKGHLKKENRLLPSFKKKYYYLVKWFNEGLQMEASVALEFIKQDYQRKQANPDLRDYDKQKNKYKKPLVQYNRAFLNIDEILNGRFRCQVDTNVSRFHSSLTNMRSTLRHCLTYEGKELVSIDIKNSQPYLSTLLLNPLFWNAKEGQVKLNIKNIRNNNINKVFNIEDYNSYIMYLKSNETHACIDIQQYLEAVTQGQFYELFMEELSDQLGDAFSDRGTVKTSLFQVLYSSNRFIGQKDAAPKRVFKDLYPTVYKLFKLIKKKDKSNLPCLLQMIESHLMINVISKRIAKERPDLPIFTIHDSIATIKGEEDYISQVVEKELFKAIGYMPKLKVEPWHPSNMEFNDGTPFQSLQTKVA